LHGVFGVFAIAGDAECGAKNALRGLFAQSIEGCALSSFCCRY
jgi:hypothetical protein